MHRLPPKIYKQNFETHTYFTTLDTHPSSNHFYSYCSSCQGTTSQFYVFSCIKDRLGHCPFKNVLIIDVSNTIFLRAIRSAFEHTFKKIYDNNVATGICIVHIQIKTTFLQYLKNVYIRLVMPNYHNHRMDKY